MKEQLIVAAVQMKTKLLLPEDNLDYMKNAIAKAKKEKNADLVVFPELSNCGYIKERNKIFGRQYWKCAEKIPGLTTDGLKKQAQKSGLYVIVGIAEQHPEIPATLYDTAVLISPNGEIIGHHRKLHMPGEEKHYFKTGSSIEVYKTEIGNIAMGICYDNQFPELARIFALKGAEILCMIWACKFTYYPNLLKYLTATRAAENRLFAISCNRVGGEEATHHFCGSSCISDPVGNILAIAGREEEIISATLKADLLYEERAEQPVFSDRRPELYSYLTLTK